MSINSRSLGIRYIYKSFEFSTEHIPIYNVFFCNKILGLTLFYKILTPPKNKSIVHKLAVFTPQNIKKEVSANSTERTAIGQDASQSAVQVWS